MCWSGGSQTLTLNVQTSQDLHLCTSCSQLLREFMLHRVKIQEKGGGGICCPLTPLHPRIPWWSSSETWGSATAAPVGLLVL